MYDGNENGRESADPTVVESPARTPEKDANETSNTIVNPNFASLKSIEYVFVLKF